MGFARVVNYRERVGFGCSSSVLRAAPWMQNRWLTPASGLRLMGPHGFRPIAYSS